MPNGERQKEACREGGQTGPMLSPVKKTAWEPLPVSPECVWQQRPPCCSSEFLDSSTQLRFQAPRSVQQRRTNWRGEIQGSLPRCWMFLGQGHVTARLPACRTSSYIKVAGRPGCTERGAAISIQGPL